MEKERTMEIVVRLGEFGNTHKLTEAFAFGDKFGKLREAIAKELEVAKGEQIIVDEKGLDVSAQHAEELLNPEKKKALTFTVFNEALRTDLDIKKAFESKFAPLVDLKNITINNGLIKQDISERYNFKPIYAASTFIEGLDLTSIQNFEQTFFNDFQLLKNGFKTFKARSKQCFAMILEVKDQSHSFDHLKKASSKTFDLVYQTKKNLKKRFAEQQESNALVLKNYVEGIQDLKKYELHPALKKENKNYLMDVYYDEQQMNKWRDSCVKSQEVMRAKLDKFEKEVSSVRAKLHEKRASEAGIIDESRVRALQEKSSQNQDEKEPLIISLISTAFEDLQSIHRNLDAFCSQDPQPEDIRQAQAFFQDIDGLQRKMKSHGEFGDLMEEHCREIELLIEDIKQIKLKNALIIASYNAAQADIRKDLKQGASLEVAKALTDGLARLEKDFTYLKNPILLPRAYEQSLLEVRRRKRFRKILDEEYKKLKSFIEPEKQARSLFMNEYGKVLPSEFIPQLRDPAPILSLEGPNKDYELPDIDDMEGDSMLEAPQLHRAKTVEERPDHERAKQLQEALKELNLQKEEHKSNVRELNTRKEELETKLKLKEERLGQFQQALDNKDKEIQKFKYELEKLNKTLKDVSLSFKLSQQANEQTIARKAKEVESLLKEKKCKNCAICLEDLKDRPADVIVKDLNDRLIAKTNSIILLEEQVRKGASLINQVSSHAFALLRTKTADFLKREDGIKQKYELQLMNFEEKLGLEQKQCHIVIKTRVADLEGQLNKAKKSNHDALDKLKVAYQLKDNFEKEAKNHQAKQRELQHQIAQHAEEKQKLHQQVKAMEEDVRRAQAKCDNLVREEKRRIEELSAKAVEEKKALEDQISREKQLLTKQLKELKERSEKEVREKNENIIRLNGLLVENCDKNQESNSEARGVRDQLDKKEKELAGAKKDLSEVTSILSKRDKEIQGQKNELLEQIAASNKLKKEVQELLLEVDGLKKELLEKTERSEGSKGSEAELEKLRSNLKTIELDYKQKTLQTKESESLIQRIKDFACTTLKIQNSGSWEASLTRVIAANAFEQINFMRAMEGARVLFMPRSEGIYVALVLKNAEEIDQDLQEAFKEVSMSDTLKSLSQSDSGPPVKKLQIQNNLFLDIESLSKNIQTILMYSILLNRCRNYEMIVIARVKGVTKHLADDQFNPFQLEEKEKFFLCQIEKIEHIVGFEGDDFAFTDYVCR